MFGSFENCKSSALTVQGDPNQRALKKISKPLKVTVRILPAQPQSYLQVMTFCIISSKSITSESVGLVLYPLETYSR